MAGPSDDADSVGLVPLRWVEERAAEVHDEEFGGVEASRMSGLP